MFKKTALSILMLGLCQSAMAADLFTVTTTVDGATTSQGFSAAMESFDSIKLDAMRARLPTYTNTSAAAVALDFRGLGMNLAYPVNSTTLTLNIPSIGLVNKTFTGATRDQSQEQLKDFFKKDGGAVLNALMKKLAETSAVDPIAGNPNSMQAGMVSGDFDRNFTSHASNIKSAQTTSAVSGLVGLGLRFGSYDIDGRQSDSITLPLSYTSRSDLDPRRQLTISAPITYTTVEGGKVYSFNPGVAYRIPMNDNWALTPAVGYGLTGSEDLASLAQMVSGSLTSSYVINMDKFDIAIGNMVGYYQTLKASSGDYSYDPGIKNTIFRNGVMLSQPINAFGQGMSIEYSLIDTRFTGDALYIDGYDEIGVTLGTNKSANSSRSYLRAGLTYLFSDKAKGFTANVGYWF